MERFWEEKKECQGKCGKFSDRCREFFTIEIQIKRPWQGEKNGEGDRPKTKKPLPENSGRGGEEGEALTLLARERGRILRVERP